MGAQVAACDCDGCREWATIHGRLCREEPLARRLAKREADRAAQRRYEDAEALLADPTRRGVA